MSKILELREKRAKAWDAAKTFLDTSRDEQGIVSAENAAKYERMENDIVSLGKEIERLRNPRSARVGTLRGRCPPNKPYSSCSRATCSSRATVRRADISATT